MLPPRKDTRERDRDRETYRSSSTFVEKKDYHPNVKVEYVDDFGRMLDPKEVCCLDNCHSLLMLRLVVFSRLSDTCHTSFMAKARVKRKRRSVSKNYKKNL